MVSSGEGMTMVARISGGRNAKIEPALMILKDKGWRYLIRSLPDTVPGVAYRTRPKGWIDSYIMPQWLSEPRDISMLPNGNKRVLYMDNCSGQKDMDCLGSHQH